MGALADFLAADHDRLDAFLSRADADRETYEAFRRGLLKHVGMEEMVLLPAAKKLSGAAVELAAKVRRDHGALTALLIPTPTPEILKVLRGILAEHNALEEKDGGLYAQCEAAIGAEAAKVLELLKAAPDIPPAPHADGPHVTASVRRALTAAGYCAQL